MTIPQALMADLRRTLPSPTLVTDAADLPSYGQDWRAPRGVPGVVVRPDNADDVVTTLRFAARHGVPVVPRGAGTNAAASFRPTPAEILLDLRPMDRIVRIDPERREAVVQPGVINGDLVAAVAPLGLLYAADPASAPLSSLGGNLMTNAGGPHCLKYGVTYHQVSEIVCVLIGGETLRLGAADAGPDLLGVIIGSEGTLAVVVEATLRLRPLPASAQTLLATFADAAAAAAAVFAVLATGVVPAALEYADAAAIRMFDHYAPSGYPADAALLLIDLDGDADAVAADMATIEAVLRPAARNLWRADDAATRATLWRGRLHAAQAIVATGQQHHLGDATVPPSRVPELQRAIEAIAARHSLAIPTLGHAGDGNLHPIILFDGDDPRQRAAAARAEEDLVEAAIALGGTITGEHGIGSDKRHSLSRHVQPAELAAMRAVKAAFDPRDLLNPDILLPSRAPNEPDLPRFAATMLAAVNARFGDRRRTAPVLAMPASPEFDPIVVDRGNRTVTASAATPLHALHTTLAAHGLRSPLPDGSATVGDAVGGDRTARASVRDTLLGVRAILPDGPTARFGSGLLKDVAGYDLKRLSIGSGTLFGRLQEATFQARVPPGR